MGRGIKEALTGTLLLLTGVFPVTADSQPLGLGRSGAGGQSPQGVLSSPAGRFVFGQISASSKDQYMLDTATGRLWRIGESGKLGTYLEPIPYRNQDGKCTALPRVVPDESPDRSGSR